jgi:hypothetical protein
VREDPMKGYIYITGTGTDPGAHQNLNDPIFAATPTLGACMPNIRRFVSPGDFVFVVSGATAGVQQYVVGGFRVEDKISALAAYERFPANRLRIGEDGKLLGNIIVDKTGHQHPLDRHDPMTFARRIEDYLVGADPVTLTTPPQVQRGRAETLDRLATILERPRTNRVIDLMGRWAKLDEIQVSQTLDWLRGIASSAQ